MVELLIPGIILGLYAGFSPGPLLVLVISQTIKHDYLEGIKVAVVPVITDLPIVLISVGFLSLISGYNLLIGSISIIGGLYVAYLAYGSITTDGLSDNIDIEEPRSLKKGITVNLLNPSPYLFWITVGGPIIITAHKTSSISPLFFIIGFYTMLVGSKIILAYMTGKSRNIIRPAYVYIMRILGLFLALFAFYLINEGIGLIFK
jgi:threonine/homoserine/homoserine lactone efflux protein